MSKKDKIEQDWIELVQSIYNKENYWGTGEYKNIKDIFKKLECKNWRDVGSKILSRDSAAKYGCLSIRAIKREFGSYGKFCEYIFNKYSNIKSNESDFNFKSSSKEKFESYKDEKGNSIYDYRTNRIVTLEDFIEYAKIDLDKFDIDRVVHNKWEVGAKDDSGKIVASPLFQIKVTLKPKVTKDADFVLKYFKDELLKINVDKKVLPLKKKSNAKYLLEISIPDLHIGKLCWGEETGFDDYDTHIAIDRYKEAITEILSQIEDKDSIDKILLPVGNDFFNSDSLFNQTTMGTPQTEDSRWQKTFKKGQQLIVEVINELSQDFYVDVVMVNGNHDTQRNFYLGENLLAYYRNVPHVNVDNRPRQRKYYNYGKTLIGFTHGNKEKKDSFMSLLMAEAKELISSCKYFEYHLGHFHSEEVKETNGLKVRKLPSLVSPDAWHTENGYVGNLKSAVGLKYHKEAGLKTIYYHNID